MSAATDRVLRGCLIALTVAGVIFFIGYPVVRVIDVTLGHQVDILREQNSHDENLADLHSPCSRVVN